MNTFNYIRVSTELEGTERQLKDVKYDVEFLEKVSAKNVEGEQLNLMLKIVQAGDLINVDSMDRLARNTQDLLKTVQTITDKGATIFFHKENMRIEGDSKNPMNQVMLTMLGALSDFERNIMLERQREGAAIAKPESKSEGKYKGRKSSLTEEQLNAMKADFNNGVAKTKIAAKYGITRSYVYQLCG